MDAKLRKLVVLLPIAPLFSFHRWVVMQLRDFFDIPLNFALFFVNFVLFCNYCEVKMNLPWNTDRYKLIDIRGSFLFL